MPARAPAMMALPAAPARRATLRVRLEIDGSIDLGEHDALRRSLLVVPPELHVVGDLLHHIHRRFALPARPAAAFVDGFALLPAQPLTVLRHLDLVAVRLSGGPPPRPAKRRRAAPAPAALCDGTVGEGWAPSAAGRVARKEPSPAPQPEPSPRPRSAAATGSGDAGVAAVAWPDAEAAVWRGTAQPPRVGEVLRFRQRGPAGMSAFRVARCEGVDESDAGVVCRLVSPDGSAEALLFDELLQVAVARSAVGARARPQAGRLVAAAEPGLGAAAEVQRPAPQPAASSSDESSSEAPAPPPAAQSPPAAAGGEPQRAAPAVAAAASSDDESSSEPPAPPPAPQSPPAAAGGPQEPQRAAPAVAAASSSDDESSSEPPAPPAPPPAPAPPRPRRPEPRRSSQHEVLLRMQEGGIGSEEDLQRNWEHLAASVFEQVEHYFGRSYAKDNWLQSQADYEGWISLKLVSRFNRMKEITHDVDFVRWCLSNSQLIEISDCGLWIRKRP